ncbi:tartrate dehydrogenase [Peribacillus butanolivorans]|uniref:tartrate dehydrogenase n=1 Tax=Peribacillus TaxID=2675229 RepID=UPI001913398E|nr:MULTISPECIES: tartrate dehydrogenase [unclassified Peribacillus]MBK5441701.1 tartrate dehydrogenase [Peribacillus sp. TH24]MBK5458375.1 tartrate dehydrogenase [Peribacillus sp. TH27]MBK5501780.1 tartrate dehydrogenase [Peribacillus sp. TH14]WMX53298.1 tartrate dehydrogenase [Peribacillus sp. R9-11]
MKHNEVKKLQKHFSIAIIPGDGIGPEVVNEGLKVLKVLEEVHSDVRFVYDFYDWNCEYYLKHGRMMPTNGLNLLEDYDTILFGAVGAPTVPDHVSVWELILPIRRHFQQYVNLRPVKLLKGLESPLRYKSHDDLDFVVIRENTEGEYSNIGGRLHEGTPYETAIQNNVFTRYGSERILKYAYSVAESRPKKRLTVATKSNAINHTMPFWDEIVKEIGNEYPQIDVQLYHIDALAAYFISKPESFDVVAGSNLFGDILTDLGAAIVGGLGLAPSGNINPERKYPSMFEPIHGSAPDIAGKGIANPIAQIWSISLMMDHLRLPELGKLVLNAIEEVLFDGTVRTPDLGGTANTMEMGDAIVSKIREMSLKTNLGEKK